MSTEFSTEKKGLTFGEFHISKIRIYLHIFKESRLFFSMVYGNYVGR